MGEFCSSHHPRNAEISELDRSFARQHDVGGLDVAMDHVVRMGVAEPGERLLENTQRFGQRHRLALVFQALHFSASDSPSMNSITM